MAWAGPSSLPPGGERARAHKGAAMSLIMMPLLAWLMSSLLVIAATVVCAVLCLAVRLW